MKKSTGSLVFCLMVFAPMAGAHDYTLQFAPNPGYRGLQVAGYSFDANNDVGGVCSYFTVSGGSGKGGHGSVKNYNQTCTWDLKGNLLSVQKGAPAIPEPVSVQDDRVVFAVNANGDTTGYDRTTQPGHGFVSSPGSHYTWLTPMDHAVLQDMVYTLTPTLKNDGDLPLNIMAAVPSALLGVVTFKSTTCIGEIAVGEIAVSATCSTVVTYDPTKMKSPTGLGHDIFRIDLTSDAGDAPDFVQNLTICRTTCIEPAQAT